MNPEEANQLKKRMEGCTSPRTVEEWISKKKEKVYKTNPRILQNKRKKALFAKARQLVTLHGGDILCLAAFPNNKQASSYCMGYGSTAEALLEDEEVKRFFHFFKTKTHDAYVSQRGKIDQSHGSSLHPDVDMEGSSTERVASPIPNVPECHYQGPTEAAEETAIPGQREQRVNNGGNSIVPDVPSTKEVISVPLKDFELIQKNCSMLEILDLRKEKTPREEEMRETIAEQLRTIFQTYGLSVAL